MGLGVCVSGGGGGGGGRKHSSGGLGVHGTVGLEGQKTQ